METREERCSMGLGFNHLACSRCLDWWNFRFIQETIAITALLVSLPIFFFALFRLWLEIGRDNGIPPAIRNRLRLNLVVFGPVAVLQLLVFVYFPESNFSGLREESD
jgi:hypothetical protein